MSRRETKFFVAFLALVMLATAAILVGLELLGASDDLMVLGVIMILVGASAAGSFLPEDPPVNRR